MLATSPLSNAWKSGPYLGLHLQAEAAAVGLVVKLVVGVHDAAQVDAAHLLRAALGLQVGQQAVNDATHTTLVLQVVHILCTHKLTSAIRPTPKTGSAPQARIVCLYILCYFIVFASGVLRSVTVLEIFRVCVSKRPWEWGSVFCMILVNSSSILSTSVRIHPRTLKGCNTIGSLGHR